MGSIFSQSERPFAISEKRLLKYFNTGIPVIWQVLVL